MEAARRAGAPEVVSFAGDLALEDNVRRSVADALKLLPRLDILVHSASAYLRGDFATASSEGFDRQYQANLRSPYLLTQLMLPRFRERGGDIVFINSTQGLRAGSGVAQFAATQHGLKALADSLREEVNADGIRVLSIHLGRTATPRQAKIFAEEGRAYVPERLMQPADVAAVIVAALRLPRTTEVTTVTMRPAVKSY